jgi:hypothetical protein
MSDESGNGLTSLVAVFDLIRPSAKDSEWGRWQMISGARTALAQIVNEVPPEMRDTVAKAAEKIFEEALLEGLTP